MNKITEVAAALIWRGDRFLICQRPEGKAREFLWEFVGGKLEKGETAEEALIRECREELDITVLPKELFMEVVHEYPDITVRLTVISSEIAFGEPKLLEHAAIRWITPEEIDRFEFCPADKDILKKIKETHTVACDEKKLRLFNEQKELLDTFLKTGALDKVQYEKSLNGLKTKLGI